MQMKLLFCVLLCTTYVFGENLTPLKTLESFESSVLVSDGVWLVQFGSSADAEFVKAAASLKGIAGCGIASGKEVIAKYGATDTFRVFSKRGTVSEVYSGDKTATAFAVAVVNAIRALIKDRLANPAPAPAAPQEAAVGNTGSGDVVKLNAKTFQELVVDTTDIWLVEFFAPWCGHCKALAPKWAQVAKELAGQPIKLGALDCTADQALCQTYKIDGYPTIKTFVPGKKSAATAEEYTQDNEVALIVKHAKELIKQHASGSTDKKEETKPEKVEKTEKADKPKAEKKKPAEEADKLVVLSMKNFEELVIKSDEPWLVEFFAPWCGHCKNLAPTWKEAAKKLAGKVNMGTVDATVESELAQKFSVQGYPTIKVFRPGKKGESWASMAEDYNGGRGLVDILRFGFEMRGEGVPAELLAGTDDDPNSAVIKLTDANFDKLVVQSADIWLVEFYAPWCGHCKNLAPEWRKAATELQGKVKVGAIDCDSNPKLKQTYNIQGFPTIKIFPAFGKTNPTDYTGGRHSAAIVQFGLELVADEKEPPKVLELIDSDVWDSNCAGKSLCVLSVLPNILDSGLKARQDLIGQLQKMSVAFRRQPFGFVWVEQGKQPLLEEALNIGGAGYPAMVVTNVKKNRMVDFQGGFNEADISEFLGRVLSGKQKTFAISKALPTIVTTDAWDGTGPEITHKVEDFDFDLDGDGIKDEL